MTQREDGSESGSRVATTAVAIGIALAVLVALWFWFRPSHEPGPGATLEIPSSMAPQPSLLPPPSPDPFVASPAPLGK